MHFSIFITLLPSVALALPNALPNQSPNPAILDVRGDVPAQGGGGLNLCWGCIEESSCTGNVKIKDLDMKNNPDVASTFSMWYDHFANDGSIIGNGDAYDKGVCCNDWCVVLENTSQRTIKYAADQVSAKAIQFTDEGGCSKYYFKPTSDDYLKLVCASKNYQLVGGKSIVDVYGNVCTGAPAFVGRPEQSGFA